MYDCQHLDHPFLHDTGVSQANRSLPALLPENVPVDGRKTADLLNYFTQLAGQINYYNPDLSVADWKPFFENSLPFALSRMAAYPLAVHEEKLAGYARMQERNTTAQGLQLLIFYSHYSFLLPLQRWALCLKGTGVDLETKLNKQIRENLQQPLLSFISVANTAAHCYGTRRIDFSGFLAVDAWGLGQADLYAYEPGFLCSIGGIRSQLLALWGSIQAALPFFTGVIGQVSSGAADDVNDELQTLLTMGGAADTPPHLALLFSFITLFRQLQKDLNYFTKYHLQYFYTQVLQLKPAPAVPDKTHLVFTIQQQFSQYLLDKGLLVKDGKDNNKADILFGLEESLVVTQAKITDTRTLFFNNLYHYDKYYTEGVYMAPNALMADGLVKPFADPSTASWSTLGSRLSKYIPTGDPGPIPYPMARLGLILHSPVLALAEGVRTITITLACQYIDGVCTGALPGELDMADLLAPLQSILNKSYFYFTQDNVAAALGQGLDPQLWKKLTEIYLTETVPDCYGGHKEKLYSASVDATLFTGVEQAELEAFFLLRTLFRLQFSGAKGWVVPAQPPVVKLTPIAPGSAEFGLVLTAVLDADQPAVTPYDQTVFGVDYQTTDPLVMVLLDDAIKIPYVSPETAPDCCLEPVAATNNLSVSAYTFFKHVQVNADSSDGSVETCIVTDVCGMKNFIVQNDQSVMDVNSPVYPFGTRPVIIDFDILILNDPYAPPKPNLVGPNFYIGSEEIFTKAWTGIWIGINWKDKPVNFPDYYVGYRWVSSADYGIQEKDFQVNLALLRDGKWLKENFGGGLPHSGYTTDTVALSSGGTDYNRKLFDIETDALPTACTIDGDYAYSFFIEPADFPVTPSFSTLSGALAKYNADTRQGFLRITLENQDFLHKDYSYVLARQMIAFGKLPDGNTVNGAVYYDPTAGYYVVDTTLLYQNYSDLVGVTAQIVAETGIIEAEASGISPALIPGANADNIRLALANNTSLNPPPPPLLPPGLIPNAGELSAKVTAGFAALAPKAKPAAVIPKEPWTPIIQNMAINYSAKATINDIGLIHLHPFDGTFEVMDLSAQPGLFPLYCAEGLLFLGVENLSPGDNLNILFELAEATADSEDAPDRVFWEYLTNNQWAPLSPDFQVVEDSTENLTRSGIVELSIPKDIGTVNTIMPAGLSWLRASVPSHTPGVSETFALFTQAVEAGFVPNPGDPVTATAANDLGRLNTPLTAGSLSKLNTPDATVTQVQQPFPSFGGKAPEVSGPALFVRISELLRHKGRGIQKWDYERLVLENFPQVWRAKCINHSFFLNAHQYLYDFPMAPGNVIVAVLPDVAQLDAADSLEPRVPLAMLEDIRTMLLGVISPFVQLFVVNPRYERVEFCLELVLVKGMDEEFFKQQAGKDLTRWLAPWLTAEMDRFEFGQPLYRSDVIRFLESLYYVDYLLDLEMTHEGFPMPGTPMDVLEPLTPRSILIAGEVTVKVDDPPPAPGKPPKPDCANLPIPVVDLCAKPIKKVIIADKHGR